MDFFLLCVGCVQRSLGMPLWLLKETKVEPSVPFPPTILTMRGFGHYRASNVEWCSQPFYSWPGGYKLRMKVFANGYSSGRNTHLSILVYLMRGENDSQLRWPFEGVVTLQLINWKENQNHLCKTIPYRAGEVQSSRVLCGEQADKGWGFPMFLALSTLDRNEDENTLYLYHDCLCFQILSVSVNCKE